MKQLLFLLLFPCLAMAQYTGNAGQKITLGEQSTADGLVFRGLAADTTRKPSVDTMAYILLDTNTNIIWQYKKATNNAWTRVGGSISSGVTGVLPVENGGTNTSTLTANKVMVGNGTSSVLTPTNLHWDNTNSRLGIGITNPTVPFEVLRKNSSWVIFKDTLSGGFFSIINGTGSSSITYPIFNFQGAGNFGSNLQYTAAFVAYKDSLSSENTDDILYFFDARKRKSNPIGSITKVLSGSTFFFGNYGDPQLVIKANDYVGIATSSPTEKLHVVGNARITGAYSVTTGSAANVFVTTDGVLQRSTSSIKYKTDVEDYSKGLKEVMQLRPVTFKSINSNNDKTYAGFIAEELADLKLNELVENNDSGEPDAISYAYMVTLLTKAIQEQQEQISLLKKRLLILENK